MAINSKSSKRWNALAEFLTEDLRERSGYHISTWLQGSYKFATQVRGARLGDEFDIDMGVYYQWKGDSEEGRHGPKELKDLVQKGLRAFQSDGIIEVVAPAKRRCCRIRFEGDFHIDVPAYHLDPDEDIRELATEENRWENSDPKALYLWFRDRFDGQIQAKVRRQVRYLKIWAALKFKDISTRPSSTLLTILTAEAFHEIYHTLEDDEILRDLLEVIVTRLETNRQVPNPVDPDEDLASRLQEFDFDAWLEKLKGFRDVANRAIEAHDSITAVDIWTEAFEHFFPLPDSVGLELKSLGALPVKRLTPNVRVQAISRDNANMRWSGMNEIGPIPRNCTITFIITNPEIFPPLSKVEWMVRNAGEEAESKPHLQCTHLVRLKGVS